MQKSKPTLEVGQFLMMSKGTLGLLRVLLKLVVLTLPNSHHLSVGSQVEIVNIKSTGNTTGVGNSGYNYTYIVAGIVVLTLVLD